MLEIKAKAMWGREEMGSRLDKRITLEMSLKRQAR